MIRVSTPSIAVTASIPCYCRANAGSWPGYVFTGDHFTFPPATSAGPRQRSPRPDEYYVIESANPKVQGLDGATRSYVEFLYELAAT